MKVKRLITGCLALLLTLSFVVLGVGCSDSKKKTGDTGNKPDESGTGDIDKLPDVKYDGYEFVIAWSNPYDYNEAAPVSDDTSELTAGSVDEAVYQRNMLTEEKLGIKISSFRAGGWTDMLNAIQNEVLSDNGAFEVYCGSIYYQFQASISNYLYNLNEIPTFNSEHEWWDQELARMYSLNSDSLYFLGGDINYCDDYGQSCLYVNTNLLKEHDMEIPYDLVREGTWTFDRFLSYIKNFATDNGDNVWDENDIYGGMFTIGQLSIMLCGFGTTMIECKSPGVLTLNVSEKAGEQAAKIMKGIYALNNQDIIIPERVDWGYTVPVFQQGQVLFTSATIGSINSYRYEMEDNFGVLPYPKYDETQSRYHCVFDTPWATAYSVMNNCKDVSRVGNILEYMGSFSRDTVYKAAIEVNAKVKAVRDDDTAEMLDLIFNSKIYEIGLWPTKIYSATNSMALKGSNTWASLIASTKDSVVAEYADVPTFYTDN